MKLVKMKICNFRCFGEYEQEILLDELTTLIGNNSSGKTAALQALLKLFSENASERNLQRSDFHLPKGMNPEDMASQELYIEAVFTFPELDKDGDEGKYIIPVYFDHFVVAETNGIPYLRVRLDASWEKGTSLEGSIESKISYITCSEDVTVTDSYKKGTNRHDLDRIRMIYVPAVRDPSKQLKNVSGTMLFRIMDGINWSEKTKEEIKNRINDLNSVFYEESGISILKTSIHDQWENYDSDYRYSNAEIQFNNTNMNSILKKSEVVFSPSVTGREYRIDEMGDGLRSLFYISMVNSMLAVEDEIRLELESGKADKTFNINPPILTIVAIEEPENHISPHLVGKLINKFEDIAQKNNAQALIASHSASIVKRIDPESIRYLRMDAEDYSTYVRKISFPSKEKEEDKYKFIKEAVQAYPEIYFAKLVVLGEGDSEQIIIPKLLDAYGHNIDSSGISVVPLGGRHVNHFWRLLNDLEIPFITLLDLDREREGGGWGRIKYVLKQLLALGKPKEEILRTTEGIQTEEWLDQMHTWPLKKENNLMSWVNHLEKYNVYFSSPLDIDFMMIECFEEIYKGILEEGEGPYIKLSTPEKGTKKIINIEKDGDLLNPDYLKRVESDIRNTLKENGGTGETYSEEQHRLMVWYNYFFLNRGKPSTHYLALSKISTESFVKAVPEVLKRMVDKIEDLVITE